MKSTMIFSGSASTAAMTPCRRSFQRRCTSIIFAVLCLMPPAALAADCVVDTSGAAIAFGVYDPLSTVPATGAGTIVVTCMPPNANNLAVTFSLSPGGSGSYIPRRMASGANSLVYNLYTGVANNIVFGNGSSGTQVVMRSTSQVGGGSFRASAQVFGVMPAEQNAAFGQYSDTIQVTITF